MTRDKHRLEQIMGQDGLLGSFEELVLLAVAHDGDHAYGMTIRRELEERSGRSVSIGAVYATLERLTAKRYLETWTAATAAGRRGRARRYYRLLPDGVRALKQAKDLHRQMWADVDLEALVHSAGARR